MNLKKVALGAALLGLTVMPVAVMADGVSLNINIGADDQAHFDFQGGMSHHDPRIWKAAQQLQNAKHTLFKARDDFHGHKMDAINAINGALDQLRICESH
ncbi:MAG TPA: hypothetical protein VN963_01890 [bacterium]|nr:hypothetical protein [bacterium]